MVRKATKIEIEGTDGAGKTTGLGYLIEKLKSAGKTVLETREVGNPNVPTCVKLRQLVLDPDSNLTGEAMEMIFSAMRFENDKWLRSVEKTADYVVSDRGWFSHLAYTDHNVSDGFTRDLYLSMMDKYTSLPDVVIYFKVNTETALQRRVKRGIGMDVIEMKGIGYQELVRTSFDKYLAHYDKTVQVYEVDANDTIEGVRAQIDSIVSKLIAEAKLREILRHG